MRTLVRRAPKDGYGFSKKRDFRRRVWAEASRQLKTRWGAGSLHAKHAMLMPSIEGDEIDTAIRVGFRQENLHVVDDNPAIVATLKRRYPGIKTYGVDVGRAVERARDNGYRLDVLSLDFTSQLSSSLITTLQRIIFAGTFSESESLPNEIVYGGKCGKGAFAAHTIVALNFLAAREQRGSIEALRSVGITLSDVCALDTRVDDSERRNKELRNAITMSPDPVSFAVLSAFIRIENRAIVELGKLCGSLSDGDRGRAFHVYGALRGLPNVQGHGIKWRHRFVVLPHGVSTYVSTNGQKFLTTTWSLINPFVALRDYMISGSDLPAKDVEGMAESAFDLWMESELSGKVILPGKPS